MMCGRYTLFSKLNSLLQQFAIEEGPDFDPRFNIAPTQSVPIIRNDKQGVREFALLRWGLIPSWSKEKSIGSRMINARSETVATKPAFRSAFKRRRCLVPTDGYYEWLRSGKRKLPYFIHMQDEKVFAMAGLWESWHNRDENSVLESFTIITTMSNDATKDLHDRMPVILSKPNQEIWLDPSTESTELESLLQPYDSDSMKLRLVTQRVNSVKNDDPTCIVPDQVLFD